MKILNTRGFSLVEALVSILIFSFVVAGIYMAFNTGSRAWSDNENNVTLQRNVRNALGVISKDLRQATGPSITQDSTSASISFTTAAGTVSYSWTTTGGNANKIIRQFGGNNWTIANNISAFSMTDLSGSVLVSVTASKPQTTGQVSDFRLSEKFAHR